MTYLDEGARRPARRTILGGALAVPVALTIGETSARAAEPAAGTPAGGPAAPPAADERWAALRDKLSGITGEWTDQAYSGSISTSMPNTALLGNGDVGVTSGGTVGVKTFYVSKGDFWAGNPGPRPLPIGGITLKSTVQPASTDLALGSTATASSVDGGLTPDRAVNGQWASGYEGWVSDLGKPQWIALDLGSVKTIARYVIRNDVAARPGNEDHTTKDLQFQVSSDGSAWTDVEAVTGNTDAIIDRDLAAPLTTRYVRLYITEPTQNTTPDSIQNPRARIGQFELYATPKSAGGGGNPAPDPFHETEHILDARITTSVVMNGTPLTLETWLAADENTLVTTVTSNGIGPVELVVQTWGGATTAGSTHPATAGVSAGTAWAQRTTAAGKNWVSTAALATRVLGATSAQTPTASGATASTVFTLAPGATATLVTCVAGGGQNPAGVQQAAVAAVGTQTAAGLTPLRTRTVAWWKNYWLASNVELGRPVLEKYYYAAQYFIGSASRPGKVAPALYGIWTTTDQAQFSGDFHMNYNAMGPFYGVYSSNRPELALPLYDVILDYVPEARRRAREDLNRVKPDYVSQRFPSGGMPDGVLFPVGIGPYGSTTDDNYWQQVADSLFAASQFCAYWEYTRDVTFLREKAYPYLKLVAVFFDNWLEWDAPAQQYAMWSGPHEGTWGKNSTPDLGMLKQTLSTLIEASHVLHTDATERRAWQDMLDRLPAQPTTVYQGATVYSLVEPGSMQGSDTRDIHPGDNTVNLEFIHPAEVLGINSPAADRAIAVHTVDVMNSWGQINSFPKVFTQAARVGYPAASLIQHFESTITQMIAANLRIADGYHGIEKSGACEAVHSMLVQSFDGVMVLFPVWPADQDASFDRLLLPGAFETSAALSAGTVDYVQVTAKAGGTLRVRNPWPDGQRLEVTDGDGHAFGYVVKDGVITVRTQPGRTYRFRPAAAR
ncbi:discoidin domain-containing protein [Actinacidiphila acididurans]|uniref:Discoidin domain-containing protein n=1 Tax=Actinacidiphila acididurans TaxID=2784346 RepID=A0ABS2TTL5_9ACTN|nr:discoidin domain-containing protein [Actinacidiphila acididurans]MBM9506684.1 discoidin domain-containing protein [Actinacidiphila acididurans]